MFDAILKSLGLSKERVDEMTAKAQAEFEAHKAQVQRLEEKLDALAASQTDVKNWIVANGDAVIALHDKHGDNLADGT